MLLNKMIRWALILAAVSVIFAFASSVPAERRRRSLSQGSPNDGELVAGVKLPARGKGFLSNPGRTNRDADYGTEELVSALRTIGADLSRWAPGATLIVNDLSLPEGGPIPRHQSHQAGRDVDLVFFMLDTEGEILRPRTARFDEKGRAQRGSGGASQEVLFDVRRNWLVLKSLVLNEEAHLQRVFVAEHLRELMLDHARGAGEPGWVIERAGEAMCQPAVPHDDHFHIRLFCTFEDYQRGCRDSWPIYPWRRTEFARLGLEAMENALPKAGTRRKRRSSRRRPRAKIGRVWCP